MATLTPELVEKLIQTNDMTNSLRALMSTAAALDLPQSRVSVALANEFVVSTDIAPSEVMDQLTRKIVITHGLLTSTEFEGEQSITPEDVLDELMKIDWKPWELLSVDEADRLLYGHKSFATGGLFTLAKGQN